MRYRSILALTGALILQTGAGHLQRIDPGLRGNWTLDVANSTFGPDGPPSAGTVRWSEHGWVLALTFPNGYVYADAVVTDNGCALIGVPAIYTCRIAVISAKHVRITVRQGAEVERVGEIELVDSKTTRTTHRVTPASGAPYVEISLWRRAPG